MFLYAHWIVDIILLDILSSVGYKGFYRGSFKEYTISLSPSGDNKTWMDKIGTGFRTVGDKLLVRLSIVPEMNRKVYTEDGQEIGKLVDIIGPVKAPIGVVSTQKSEDFQGKVITVQ